MTDTTYSSEEIAPPAETLKKKSNAALRLLRYTVGKFFSLFLAVLIGMYLVILIANMGGYVDQIMKAQIRDGIGLQVSMDPELRRRPPEERQQLINELVAVEEHRLGLDKPFITRSFRFLYNAMTLNLGRAQHLTSDSGSASVRLIILERLPPTLLFMSIASFSLFFLSLVFALFLSRNYGSFVDKLVIALSPTSSAPPWFYGIFLLLIFAALLGWLPFGGMVDAPPPEDPIKYALSLGRHLVLPVAAWLISGFFASVYSERTFFLIFSMEDYVELARAKGLSARDVERRYILRPTLPNIITSFALMLIGLWQGALLTETIFNWPGLGRMLYRGVQTFDTPVIIGSNVIYAYLLAITVFILDFIYALVDPRVRMGSGGPKA
ncbi:MAG: Dipeptide transport system permease protein DppB [Chloroflexi bacterium ADurb.Bin120]|jgi:peptide/nickel transport system permease protein|uniref:Putative oligopeptide ABC transporter permease protein n=1 Tax=Candidatus Brevifilum fermentans TaxID=1986204 RepID=A0A1Y6K0D6_9CHLR|nr:ABC transporter permease [Brevefilum fermentans]MDI9567064.1 ABC transporter permease [Chloroflexota bacterium]OQB88039.1 MAG: Dipeptide transport system permease protein DppB [Chloroflexi bacterium ADurb.Bin120]SMX53101.1 putative oligopeptide ABC transporter permease protein [Brevefilum fermentans]HOM67436.1 ABC transporter permease [Brevefilum fermentans]HPX95117.1 ABC transporter permease [Brevefilum fermentans]